MNLSEIDVALTTAEFFIGDGVDEAFRMLRDEDPVHVTKGNFGREFWSVTRHADVLAMVEDADLFSSRGGAHLPMVPTLPTEEERLAQGLDFRLPSIDAPRHPVLRRPINKYFSVPAVRKMRGDVEAIVDEILVEMEGRDEVDFVTDIAAELPARLFMNLFHVPKDEQAQLRAYTNDVLGIMDPNYVRDGKSAEQLRVEALVSMQAYLQDLGARRRKEPLDNDFATVVAHLEVDGENLTERQMGWYNFSLMLGGLDSVRNTCSLGMEQLLAHPDQMAYLRENPAGMTLAVEEILRFATPSKNRFRIATRDAEFAGRQIREGDWMVGWTYSANRDERVFKDPHLFDVTRDPNPHVSFSAGVHMCLGRNLSRIEIETLMNKVFTTYPNIAQSGPRVALPGNNISALKSLPVSLGNR